MSKKNIQIENYQNGVCNIGNHEKKLRRRSGYFGLILTVLGLFFIILMDLDPVYSLLLVFPIYLGVIGFYQDKASFCVAFGFNGVYNMDENKRKIKKVQDTVQRKIDRRKVIRMNIITLLVSSMLTISLFFVKSQVL